MPNTRARQRAWCCTTRSAIRSASSATAKWRAGSAPDQPLHEVGIARALYLDTRCGVTDFTEVVVAQLDVGRCQVLLEPVQTPGAGNRDDPRPLSQQPGQRDLPGRRAFAGRDPLKQIDHGAVGLADVGAEPRDAVADVGFVELRVLADASGEKALAQRAVGHEAEAEFGQRGQHPGLWALRFAPPQGVLALYGRHRLHGVGTANRLGRRLRHPEVLYLPTIDQFLDGSRDVLDGNLGVDPVLVQQVDGVYAQSAQRIVGDLFDVLGPTVQPRDIAVGAEGETEFCCDHNLSGERR